jgi:KTSC domain-containing protein
MRPVDSSHIESVGHDPNQRTMYVKYRDGGMYAYPSTSAVEYTALLAAPSKGKHLRTFHAGKGHKQQSSSTVRQPDTLNPGVPASVNPKSKSPSPS